MSVITMPAVSFNQVLDMFTEHFSPTQGTVAFTPDDVDYTVYCQEVADYYENLHSTNPYQVELHNMIEAAEKAGNWSLADELSYCLL